MTRAGRVLGLDYGSRTVGVALSDALGLTAQPLETIERKQEDKLRRTLARIEALIAEHEVREIVLGLPKNMNNTIGERAKKTEEFAERLRARLPDVPVTLWDERGTTKSAIYVLNEANVRNKKRKKAVDTVAAVIILQSYLDFAGGTKPAGN